jgi:hypothetical protein
VYLPQGRERDAEDEPRAEEADEEEDAVKIGEWYRQSFSDQDVYFRPTAEQKNGGFSGTAWTVDHTRPRAKAKPKKTSVGSGPRGTAAHWEVLWRWVPEPSVPKERFA